MRLILARQAIYDASTLKEIGSEILSRWITNTNKVFCPSDINPDWALVDVEVISQLSSNTNNLCTNSDALFLNVSKELLSSNKLFSLWLNQLEKIQACYDTNYIVEVTEGIPPVLLDHRYKQIRATGVRLALDDLGEGHSNNSRLMGFEWDFCKINVSLLENRTSKEALDYCRKTGIAVIAECVEDSEHFVAAHKAQIKLHQGFYWQRPEFVFNAFKVAAPC